MRPKLALACMLAVALFAPAALPCGAPFGNGINVDPKQDIVVAHKNGVETYVFQPRFCGSAQEFGLILPIPAKLSTAPALSKGDVFTYLDSMSKPTDSYVTQCSRGGVGGSSGGTGVGGAGSGTVVVSSGTVGFMDYSQLEATSVSALTAWLDSNGYPYDSLGTSAFDYYVQKGWLFVAFKVNQGTFSGTTTCKDLGPVKLTFPTDTPVVPTRMASARSKDMTGTLAYGTGFSWRVYGITSGSEQIGFTSGTSGNRVLNYSGLLVAGDISHLDGLGMAGDRADKLTVTFSYGSTDPDVALAKVAGTDYREVVTHVSYVNCDGGTDLPIAPIDAGADVAKPADVAVPADAASADNGPGKVEVASVPDAADAARDAYVSNPPELGKADSGVIVQDTAVAIADAKAMQEASVSNLDAFVAIVPDAARASDAPPFTVEPPAKKHSGCSLSPSSEPGALVLLLVAGLLINVLRRRRESR